MFCDGSLVFFYKICALTNNCAQRGGAVYLLQHVQYYVARGATVIIANNTASADGGRIYLSPYCSITLHSQSALHILENSALECGGGIYASQSSSINHEAVNIMTQIQQ